MRTNFERNLEDSVDRVKNSVACNDVKKNNECAPFLGLHLDKFVSCGRDLFSSSCLEVCHTRGDVLALPS